MVTNANNDGVNSDAPVNRTLHQMEHKKKPITLRARNFATKSLRFGSTIVGIAVAANVASHYYESNQVDSFFGNTTDSKSDREGTQSDHDESKGKSKKCVLVLPFQNLKLVERRSGDFDDLKRLGPDRNKQPTIVLEAKELVKIIHTAASDPNVTALHADFGEGMRFPMGLGHMEEIRNAIRVFNESHRVHRDPNVNHNPVFAMPRNGDPKTSYAFGHSFQWNEYFLASSFTYVALQARGNLHLFGVTLSNTFIRSALDKYGIKVHVFKHGDYKTAPNIFTEDKYSKSHLEAVKSMTSSLNNTICSCIERSRGLKFDSVMWKSIFDYGSLTSANAAEIGLVDSLFPVDPLLSLLHANKEVAAGEKQESEDTKNTSKEKRTKLEEVFGLNKSFDRFVATEQVSLLKYHEMMNKKAKLEERRKFFTKLAESSTAASIILSTIGLAPREPKLLPSKAEKVAVVTVDGSIGSALSYEVIEALRNIRTDETVKCMVLRVNSPGGSVISSEAILEEIKILGKVNRVGFDSFPIKCMIHELILILSFPSPLFVPCQTQPHLEGTTFQQAVKRYLRIQLLSLARLVFLASSLMPASGGRIMGSEQTIIRTGATLHHSTPWFHLHQEQKTIYLEW
ncbi:hypothetical protein ACHAXM_004548 [Skeletonema potamos]